jgi:hypothetical protein
MKHTITGLIATALVAVFLWPSEAKAHSWYDPQCCSGQDCEAIPESAITLVEGGYRVRYKAKLGLEVDVIVPFSEARMSRDGSHHGCANQKKFLCLYVAGVS